MRKAQQKKRVVILVAVFVVLLALVAVRLVIPREKRTDTNLLGYQMRSLALKIERYRADRQHLPTQLHDLLITEPHGAYAIPRDLVDPWKRQIIYRRLNDHEFVLFSLGQDGALGGKKANQDIQLRYMRGETTIEKF